MIKIGIAEDHRTFREAMISAIEDNSDFTITLQAGDGQEFMDRLNPLNMPDVVLVDVKMPTIDGPELVQIIRKNFGETPKLLALSMYSDRTLVMDMLNKGANGYVTKSIGISELLSAIQKVYENEVYLGADIARYINLDSDGSQVVSLNEKEIEILKLICEQHTNAQIAEILDLPASTVNTYRTRMIDKLNARNTVGLVLYAIKTGIHWVDY